MNTLQSITNGMVDYVAVHTSNYETIQGAIDSLEANAQAIVRSTGSSLAFQIAVLGPSVVLVGSSSYAASTSGALLSLSAGFIWRPDLPGIMQNPTAAAMDFTGLAAGTYYISPDASGTPTRSSSTGPYDIYAAVWDGSAFTSVTRIMQIVWNFSDDELAQVSTALGATYDTLDDRLEAGEAASVGGALARIWQTGRLSLSVAGSADVTLDAVQANNAVLDFTGALTGDISVIVPLGVNPREWIVTNNTTGAHTLTVKGATGTGISVAQGGFSNLYQDGTNVLAVSGSGAGFGTVTSVAATVPSFLSIGGSPVTSSGTLAITYSGTALPIANGGTGGTSASAARTALGLGTSATLDVDTDTAMAANSDTRVPSQKAVAAFVASFMANFDTKPECAYASTSPLPANTYSNGTSGVGATLTGNVNGPLVIDSATLAAGAVGLRILVAGEGTDSHNGWFTLTQLGVVAVSPYILTRDTLSDQASEIAPGYLTAVEAPTGLTAGSSNNGKLFMSVCPTPFTVGSSSLNFTPIGAAGGTVTTVSVTTANGVSGTVTNPTSTPAITLTLGAITPSTVNGVTLSGSSTPTLAVTGTTTVSGANTGDQTTVSGNAGTATTLQTSRNIDGQAFNGSADITVIAPGTHAATGKTTPVDADEMPLVDSAASNVLKKVTWANVKATLKTYFDTLYATVAQPFDVFAFLPDLQTSATQKILRVKLARAVTFAANFSGSYFAASANAAGTAVFDVQKNGSSIGSISIASGGTTATFTTSGGAPQTFAAGDLLAILGPATPDTTLADCGFTLVGAR